MTYFFKTPAKINLFLKITGVDPQSGLHFLETLMSPIDFFDEMTISRSDILKINTVGSNETIKQENNIIYKMYSAIEKKLNITLPKYSILLKKNVPAGAGLGGGSSNGATILKFLNNDCNLGLTMPQMIDIASEVGSDIPFFLYESPAMVYGTGNIIKPVKISNKDYFLLLVYPGISVNTGLAYHLYDKKNLTKQRCMDINPVRKSGLCSLNNWASEIVNDFEETVFEHWSGIRDMKNLLESFGAAKVFMSGSGSSLVALFSDNISRTEAETKLSDTGNVVKKIELLTG
jgi:4-diphosphocytidyl-2-C-methyl-D-erythritol kinase